MATLDVIMPAFNASKYIEEAIESVLNQTFKDLRLLICDDGSTDNTLSIINNYAERDDRVKVFKNEKNLGNLLTTNILFAQCTAKYMGIQDADDYSALNRFEVLLNMFANDSQLGMVGSNYELVNTNKEAISCSFLPESDAEIKSVMNKECIPILYAGVVIRKDVLDKVGGFRPFFNRIGYADLDWLNRCGESYKAANSKEILYYYRQHDLMFTKKSNISVWTGKKNIVQEFNMNLLLVNAHHTRVKYGNDYFESADLSSMKKYLSEYYINAAEVHFWEGRIKRSFQSIFTSIRFNPLALKNYRIMLYICRKSVL